MVGFYFALVCQVVLIKVCSTVYLVKFFSADGHIAILGNGNQDSQSWFHSQVNTLFQNE